MADQRLAPATRAPPLDGPTTGLRSADGDQCPACRRLHEALGELASRSERLDLPARLPTPVTHGTPDDGLAPARQRSTRAREWRARGAARAGGGRWRSARLPLDSAVCGARRTAARGRSDVPTRARHLQLTATPAEGTRACLLLQGALRVEHLPPLPEPRASGALRALTNKRACHRFRVSTEVPAPRPRAEVYPGQTPQR